MSLRMRLPSPRRTNTQRMDANDALLKARINKPEVPEPVGVVVTRPHRVERDGRSLISSTDPGVGALKSIALGEKATHLVVGSTKGSIAVITVSTLYSGQPQIIKAKVPGATNPIYVASSAGAETIIAFESSDRTLRGGKNKAHVFSRSLSLKFEIERSNHVHACAVTPDGNKVAVADANKKVAVYSVTLTSKSQIIEYDVTPYVFEFGISLSFAHSGRWLAMGGDMRKACVWDQHRRDQNPLRVFGRGGHINALDFSPSDKWLAIGSGGDNLLTLVDTATWDIMHEELQPSDVHDVSFSYDELAISLSSMQGAMQVMNRASLETTHEIPGKGRLLGRWTPDGTLVVMTSDKIDTHDYKTRRDMLLPETDAPNRLLKAPLALSVHGKTCAYAARDKVVTMAIGFQKEPSINKVDAGKNVVGLAFAPDNTKLAVLTDSELRVFKNDQNNKWPKLSSRALGGVSSELRWSKSAKLVAVYGRPSIYIVRANDCVVVAEKQHDNEIVVDLARISPEFAGHAFGSTDKLKAAVTPILVALGAKRVQEAMLSPDGNLIAAGGNGVLSLVDRKTMESTLELATKGWVMGLAWAPDSKTLAIGAHDKTVQVVHVASGIVIAHLGERQYWPTALAFSADCGVVIDSGSFSNKPKICVSSCDGSTVPLIEPLDAGALLRMQAPTGLAKRSAFTEERVAIVAEMVELFPRMALNPLDPADKELQPLGQGAARLTEVLATRTERPMLEALFDKVPALALLPSKNISTPTFDLALKLRDVRTLRVLFLAGARAPVPLRGQIARTLIPAMVEMRMSSAVTAFLEQCELEDSGADITSGCNIDGSPLVEDDVLELHPTWGGAGTAIWLDYHTDVTKAKKLMSSRHGEVVNDDGTTTAAPPGWFGRLSASITARFADATKYAELEAESRYKRFHSWLGTMIESIEREDVRKWLKDVVFDYLPDPDASRAHLKGARAGVEVNALRVPIPFLSSKDALEALGQIPYHGTFDNACMRATINCLWNNHFFASHLVKTLLHAVHAAAFTVYCVQISAGRRVQLDSGSEGTVGRYAAFMLIFMSAYITFFEVRQLLGQQLYHGPIKGALLYWLSLWNVADVLLAVSVVAAVMLDLLGGSISEGHFHVKGLLAGAAILMLVRSAQMLRGFALTGWLVMVLLQNLQDMIGFIFLVLLTILFFAIAFMMLFRQDRVGDPDYDFASHATLTNSLMNTFTMGVFGDFELGTFEEGMMSSVMAKSLFVVFMVIVGVVSLNALIAFLGDSYAKVQERQVEATLSLKASLIVEYYNAMGPFAARRERQVAWTHVLRIIKDEDGMKRQWQGQVTQIKREVTEASKGLQDSITKQMSALNRDMEHLKMVLHAIAKNDKIVLTEDSEAPADGARSIETDDV